MKKRKLITNGILIVVLLFLLSFEIITVVVFPDYTSSIMQKKLISEGIIHKTQSIKLTQGDTPFSLMFTKTLAGWYITIDEKHYFQTTNGMVERFIDQLSIRRSLHKVGTEKGIPYGIGTSDSFVLSFLDSNNDNITSVIFGNTDATGADIYLKLSDGKGILRTKNTFSDLLTMKAASWVNLSIFSGQSQKNQIEEIQYSKGSVTKMYRAPHDAEITRLSDVLESLICVDITNINAIPSERLTIIFGDTHSLQISFAAFNDVWILKNETDGNSYIITSAMKENIERALD